MSSSSSSSLPLSSRTKSVKSYQKGISEDTQLLTGRRRRSSILNNTSGGKRGKYVAMRRRDGRLPLASKDKNVSTSISSSRKIGNSGASAEFVKGQLLGFSEYDTKSVKGGNSSSNAVTKSELLSSADLLSVSNNEKQSTSEIESYRRLKRLILKDRDATRESSTALRKQTRTRAPEDYDREIEFAPKKYDEIPYVPDDYSPLEESHIQKLREFHSDALFKDFGNHEKDQDKDNSDIQQPDGLLKLEVFHDVSDSESDSNKDQEKIKMKITTAEVRSENGRNLTTVQRQQANSDQISNLKVTLEQPDFSSEPVELDPIYHGQGLSPEDLEELLLD